jgi:hypothetical protein
MNFAQKIIDFENGILSEEEIVDLFQSLVDSGMINHLQGFYQRIATEMIDIGLVKHNG